MTKKRLVKGFSSCAVLPARLLFLGAVVLAPAGSGFAGELVCEINVASQGDQWRDQINAVGLLEFSKGTEHCTGTLLNNSNNPRKPYFLTARHCFDGEMTMGDPGSGTV